LLRTVARIADAPLSAIAELLHEAVRPYTGSDALVIFTEECTGRPQKKAGDAEVVARVSIAELQQLRDLVVGEGPWTGTAQIAGRQRQAFALKYGPSNALLVVTYAGSTGGRAQPAGMDSMDLALETILAAARSGSLDDATARATVSDAAAKALVELRTHNDQTAELVKEPVATAFERLREDLRPLTRFSGIDVQFIEPPLNGRALPGEVAIAARAIVRGLLLAMMEQPEVRRVRTQWDCDGENLLINVRDDGRGGLSADAPNMERLQRRVQALDGRMEVDLMPGWGADITVTLPLDPPVSPADVSGWNLAARELEVLQLLAAGQRNRSIAAALSISENTVKFHVRNLFRKLGVASRTEAIALAHSHGLR
jgi:DNA-binding CsgD family transcriptional regulator